LSPERASRSERSDLYKAKALPQKPKFSICSIAGKCGIKGIFGVYISKEALIYKEREEHMNEISYLNFDLLIERAGEGYRARVLESPAGQATVAFRLPFPREELKGVARQANRHLEGIQNTALPNLDSAKAFGGRLFEAVFEDTVRGCLHSSMNQVNSEGTGLRLRLRLTDVPELANLPWEYLYDQSTNQFLSLSVETPVVRYLEIPQRIRPLKVKPPIRVLVMISSPRDYPPLDVEREWEKLNQAFGSFENKGLVKLERLDEATLAALQRKLLQRAYQIFHFIGHGVFDEKAQDGVLILEDEEERGFPVSGQRLGTILHDHRSLRLAILNACEGARCSKQDTFAGTAQSLVQRGLPAVIAMQFPMTDKMAINFAHWFYEVLAQGYPVDTAMAEARKNIFTQGNEVEWGAPVLYMRSPDGKIFNLKRIDDLTGQIVSHYKILKKLGEGRVGVVFTP
jgi:hypothetical protein